MSEERVQVVFGANITDLTTKVREAHLATKEAVEGINHSIASMKQTFTGLSEALLAFTAAEMFAHMIEETAELASHLEVLSQKTGMAVEDLSRLRYAADLSHISVDTLDTGMARLARGMQDAARGGATPASQAFQAMGISVTDAHGKMREMKEVLLDVAEKFATYEDGAGKSALAMNLFGRSGAELVPLLNKGKEGIKDLGAESDRLGSTMNAFQVETAVEYENSMKRMEAGARGLKQTIAVALMPVLGSLAEAFTHSGDAGELLTGTLEIVAGALRFVGTVAVLLKGIVQDSFETIRLVFEGVATLLSGVAMAFLALAKGEWSGASAIIKDTFHDMADQVAGSNRRMKASADETMDSLARLYGFTTPKDPDAGEAKRSKQAPRLKGKAEKETSTQLADAVAEWQAIRDGTSATGDALLAIERDFWTKKLTTIRAGEKDTESATLAMNGKRLAAEHRLAGDLAKAAVLATQSQRESQLEAIDVEKQAIEERRGLRQIDAKTAEAQLLALSQRSLEIKLTSLGEEYEAAEGDLVKQATIWKQMEAAQRAHGREAATIGKQTTLEIAKQWEHTFSTITNTIRKSFDGVIMGTQTLRDAFRHLNRNMLLDFTSSKLDELKVHIAAEKAKEGATWGSVASRVAAETWAALKSVAMTAWSALTNIAAYAAEAAAATWAAISAIPFVGPFLAPAAAGLALGGVLALGGHIASAAGGYDIPAGINPMTQLHAQEMVLPASLANAVRSMASSGGGEGGGGQTVMNVYAMDAQSFRDFAKRNPDGFGDGVAGALKNNHTELNKAMRGRG